MSIRCLAHSSKSVTSSHLEDIWAFPLPRLDHEHVDDHNSSHQEQRDQGLGEHYMKPRITAPQNKNARAAAKSAWLSKER
jgi:hypothetical protein